MFNLKFKSDRWYGVTIYGSGDITEVWINGFNWTKIKLMPRKKKKKWKKMMIKGYKN